MQEKEKRSRRGLSTFMQAALEEEAAFRRQKETLTLELGPSNIVLHILRPISFLSILAPYWLLTDISLWLLIAIGAIFLGTNALLLLVESKDDDQWFRRLWFEWVLIAGFCTWAGIAAPMGPHAILFGISVLTAYISGYIVRGHRVLIASVVVWLLPVPWQPWESTSQMASHLAGDASLLTFFAVIGFLIGRGYLRGVAQQQLVVELEASRRELQAANAQLQTYAEQAAELAALDERNRLSRDIHDTVGHGLTALLVQLQASRRLAEQEGEGVGGVSSIAERLAVAENLARGALQEVRLAVQALRLGGSGAAGQRESLARLTGGFMASTGLQVDVIPDWPTDGLPPDMMEAVYRAIQESLTNAFRHGEAGKVTIDFTNSTNAELRLRIADDGRGCEQVVPGLGLAGLAERCAELGGTLTYDAVNADVPVGTAGRGFALHIRLPFDEGKEASA